MPANQSWWGYQGARLRALGKRRGTRRIRAMIWDWEHRAGQWAYLESSHDRPLLEYVAENLGEGRLLDLGCGNGVARCDLPPGLLTRYVGVDISAEAITRTRERAADLEPLRQGEEYYVGDIADPAVLEKAGSPFDVILVREVIYFVDLPDVPAFLNRLGGLLAPGGVIIIRIFDRHRYADHVTQIHKALRIVEERESPTSTSTLLVLAV